MLRRSTAAGAALVVVGAAVGLAPVAQAAQARPKPPGVSASAAGENIVVGPDSPIRAGSGIARFRTINQHTRQYYMLRSYLEYFEATGGGTLTLGPGEYRLPSTLYVASNTTIALSAGTVLTKTNKTGTRKFKASKSMFMLIRPSLGKRRAAVGGHGGESDINIVGAGGGRSVINLAGIYNTLGIIAGHNRRVHISGITFTNMNNNHFVEMDACADCSITDSQFANATSNTRRSAEAVNLDTPDALTDGFGSVWSNLDGTPNEGVLIANNSFTNLVRAVGTHNYTADRFHSDVVLRNNYFSGFTNDAIRIMNWRDPVITDNTFDNVRCPGYGNDCRAILASGAINPMISNNRLTNMVRSFQFMPWRNAGKASVYPTTYNQLTEASKAALTTNVAGPGLVESFVRISSDLAFYAPIEKVYLEG